jgi:hypothetical protein
MGKGHKTVKVSCPWTRDKIDIDVELAPLIPLLWACGIETNQCCQEGRPGEACIEFPGTREVMEFLHVAQSEYKVELERQDEVEDGELSIVVRLLVFFPTEDVPGLVEAFTYYANELADAPP